MVYYEPDQPELYHGRNLDPAYHRFAHRQRVELVHAYDEAQVTAALGRFDGTRLHAGERLRGPGRGRRQHHRAPELLRSRAAPTRSARAPGRRPTPGWPSSPARVPNALTFLYLPDEPYPAEYPHVRQLAENVHSNPGPGGRLAHLRHQEHHSRSCRAPSTSGACRPRPTTSRRPTRSGSRAAGSGSTTAGGRRDRPSSSTLPPPTPASWPGPPSSTTSTSTSSGTACTGSTTGRSRASAGRTSGPTRSPSTTAGSPEKPIDDQGYLNGDGVLMYPGEEKVHPEEDRGLAGPVLDGPAREPPPRPAGPPLPDPGPEARPRGGGRRGPGLGRAPGVLRRGGDGRLRGDRRRLRGRAPGPGPGHRGPRPALRPMTAAGSASSRANGGSPWCATTA